MIELKKNASFHYNTVEEYQIDVSFHVKQGEGFLVGHNGDWKYRQLYPIDGLLEAGVLGGDLR